MRKLFYYDELERGREIGLLPVNITKEIVDRHIGIYGGNGVHLEDAVQNDLVPVQMALSLIDGLISDSEWLHLRSPIDVSSASLKVVRSFFVGDTMHVTATITDVASLLDKSRDYGCVCVEQQIQNQHGEDIYFRNVRYSVLRDPEVLKSLRRNT